MSCGSSVGELVNSYALVSYIPGPLGSFLDTLRQELVCSCRAQSHVTVLPPRPLFTDSSQVIAHLAQGLQQFCPFRLEIAGIEVFPDTNVIYLALGRGASMLQRMHLALNSNELAFEEPYDYHPHITLAQELPPEQVASTLARARNLWAQAPAQRSFEIETLTFVQNSIVHATGESLWVNLADCPLGRLQPCP